MQLYQKGCDEDRPYTARAPEAAQKFGWKHGVIMKGAERLATEISRRGLALVLACLIPSFVSITLTFMMHSFKGTPRPLESTIPTMIFVFPSTAVWGYINRRKYEKRLKADGEK